MGTFGTGGVSSQATGRFQHELLQQLVPAAVGKHVKSLDTILLLGSSLRALLTAVIKILSEEREMLIKF